MEQEKLNQLKLQAEQGGIEAQCELAYYYKKEKRDYGRALTWYLKAAEAGHSLAQCRVGRIYFDERNYEQAVYWLSKSAEQGDAVAQCELANCYEKGYGVEKDMAKHIYWLRLSAEQGYTDAMWSMFLRYAWGTGVERDVEKAKYWFFKRSKLSEQSAVEKAENGDASWQYDLGILYYRMEDWNTAVYWYKKVVEQEYEFKNCALWAICSCYRLMNNWEEAKSWAIVAAEWTKTSNDQYECARLHEEAGDMDTATLWYQKAAENGSARAKLKISDLNNKIR